MGGFVTPSAVAVVTLPTMYRGYKDTTTRSFGSGIIGCTVVNRHYIGPTGKPQDMRLCKLSNDPVAYNIVIEIYEYYNYSWDYYFYIDNYLVLSQLVGAGNAGSGTVWKTFTLNQIFFMDSVIESAMHPWGPAASGALYYEYSRFIPSCCGRTVTGTVVESVTGSAYTFQFYSGVSAYQIPSFVFESEIEEIDGHLHPRVRHKILELILPYSKTKRVEFLRYEVIYKKDKAYVILTTDEGTANYLKSVGISDMDISFKPSDTIRQEIEPHILIENLNTAWYNRELDRKGRRLLQGMELI
jgi:hypothetical protein